MKIHKTLALFGITIGLSSCYNSATPTAITHFEWGKIVVGSTTYKDCRIWPGHHEEWDWSKTGTRHNPGIQIADLSDFIDNVDVIILSEGVDGILQIKPETLNYIRNKQKTVHVLRTPEAIKKYNELVSQQIRVGALLHSTC